MLTLNFKSYYKTACYEDQLDLHCNFCVLKHCVYRIMCMYV